MSTENQNQPLISKEEFRASSLLREVERLRGALNFAKQCVEAAKLTGELREGDADYVLGFFESTPPAPPDVAAEMKEALAGETEARAIAKLITFCPFCKLSHNPEKSSCDGHNGKSSFRIRNRGPITRDELIKLGLLAMQTNKANSVVKP